MAASLLLRACALAAALLLLRAVAPQLSSKSRLPLITVHLAAGAVARAAGLLQGGHGESPTPSADGHLLNNSSSPSAVGFDLLHSMAPLHSAALGVITIAAGSELAIEQLRANASSICAVAAGLSISAVLVVAGACYTVLAAFDLPSAVSLSAAAEQVGHLEGVLSSNARGLDAANGLAAPATGSAATRRAVIALLAGVVSIARSPSSAIAVVSEMKANGAFTKTMLGVTMLTDLGVIVLFTATTGVSQALLAPEASSTNGILSGALKLTGTTAMQFGLSAMHAAVLAVLVAGVLCLPSSPAGLRAAALLALGWYAFRFEPFARAAMAMDAGPCWIEPMLSCMLAGSLVCNDWRRRHELHLLLSSTMPDVLLFFFFTTGGAMDSTLLLTAWPAAVGLCAARIVSMYVGAKAGASCSDSPPAMASYGWLAFVTQAGVSLGLTEEIGAKFEHFGKPLETALAASIVLNQLIGPPMLKLALRRSGEAFSAPPAGREWKGAEAAGESAAEAVTLGATLASQSKNPDTAAALVAAAAAAAASASAHCAHGLAKHAGSCSRLLGLSRSPRARRPETVATGHTPLLTQRWLGAAAWRGWTKRRSAMPYEEEGLCSTPLSFQSAERSNL